MISYNKGGLPSLGVVWRLGKLPEEVSFELESER